MGARGSTVEQQRKQRQEQLADFWLLELWLVEPPPRRKINARAIETAEEFVQRVGSKLEIDSTVYPAIARQLSDRSVVMLLCAAAV